MAPKRARTSASNNLNPPPPPAPPGSASSPSPTSPTHPVPARGSTSAVPAAAPPDPALYPSLTMTSNGHGHGQPILNPSPQYLHPAFTPPNHPNNPATTATASSSSTSAPTAQPLLLRRDSSASTRHTPAAPTTNKNNKPKSATVADEIVEVLGGKKDRKRKRAHYSCAECHRRKRKCDRKVPCQACIEHGTASECRPFEDGDQHGDIKDRVLRLEDIVEGLAVAQTTIARGLADAKGLLAAGASGHDVLASLVGIAQIALPGGAVGSNTTAAAAGAGVGVGVGSLGSDSGLAQSTAQAAGEAPGASSTTDGSMEPSGPSDEQPDDGEATKRTKRDRNDPDAHELEIERRTLDGQFANDGDSWFGALALPSVSRGVIETEIRGERLELGARMPRYPASHKLNRLIYEGGAPPEILTELMAGLPPRAQTDQLLTLYFNDINWTRLPIQESDFRASYEDLMEFRWGDAEERLGDDGARHLPFLSLLYAILAIARQANAEDNEPVESAARGATRFYHLCRKCTLVASVIRVDHVDLVLTHLFTARFLTVQRKSAEAWSQLGTTIRAAQAIGLHRDGSKLGMDAITTERRRRIWALIFWMDKTTSILLGRPQAIQEMHCDTLPPSDIDLDTMPRYTHPLPPQIPRQDPDKPPGVIAYVTIRDQLAKLTGRIVEHFQNLSSPRKYSDCLQLDQDLELFIQHLAPPYRCEAAGGQDKRFDAVCPWLPLHRYLLNIEYHYVRIALHRPYVLRNSEKYAQSRKAAFQSAKMDRLIRFEYKRDVRWPSDRARKVHMGGLYRLFNATMMMGVALLLDPNSLEASEYKKRLDEFIEQHRVSDYPDLCSKREVRIIELFRTKARDPSWCAATATGSRKGRLSTNKTKAAASTSDAATAARPTPPTMMSTSRTTRQQDKATPPVLPVTTPTAGLSGTPENGSTTSSHDHTADLAQSIFDQLRGDENFGLYRGPAVEEDGLGQGMSLDSVSGGIEDLFLDLWNPNGLATGSSGVPPMVLPQAQPDGTDGLGGGAPAATPGGAFTPVADPSTLTLNAPVFPPAPQPPVQASTSSAAGQVAGNTTQGSPPQQQQQQPTVGPSHCPNLAPHASGTPRNEDSTKQRAPSTDKDMALLPWGGLIEAIYSSSTAPTPTRGRSPKARR